MPGTQVRDFADLAGAKARKEQALDLLTQTGQVDDGRLQGFVDYYGPLLRRVQNNDDRDQVKKVMRALEKDMDALESSRQSLVLRGYSSRKPDALLRIQQILAVLEQILKKLHRYHHHLQSQHWAWIAVHLNPAMHSTRKKPTSKGEDEEKKEIIEPARPPKKSGK